MFTQNTLINKNILITGASSGIGREVAIKASALGANIIIVGRNLDSLNETYKCLDGNNHFLVPLDLLEFEKIEGLIEPIIAKLGQLDGFVHCAGIDKVAPLKITTPGRVNEVFNINVLAGIELARIISKKKNINPMGASFVFISSVMGRLGDVGKIAYCASKSSIIGAMKAMALELAPMKIRSNAVLPGVVETQMVKELFDNISSESKAEIIRNHPLGIGTPEDVAALVCFLLSNESKWITGSEITIDGGYSAK